MKTKIFGHRGFSGKFPENTMLAFEESIQAGAHGLEIDVQLSRDNHLVVFHDESLQRVTGIIGYLKDYSLNELQEMDVGSHFHPSFKGLKMPSLKEVLILAKERNLWLNIELKNGILPCPGLEEQVVKEVEEIGLKENVILSSFNHYSLLTIKNLDPTFKTGILYFARMVRPSDYALSLGASALNPYYLGVDKQLIEEAKKSGLAIYTYTVNQIEDMRRLVHLGVHSIITDHPDKLASVLFEESS